MVDETMRPLYNKHLHGFIVQRSHNIKKYVENREFKGILLQDINIITGG